jgi:uncharacterized protein (TIGR03083 family)
MNPHPDHRAPSDLDYLSHLARDSARFVAVLRQTPPETRVPTCPDWDADDLLWHLAEVQWFWGTIVGRGITTGEDVEALDNGGRPGDRDGLLALFGQASGDLHRNLSTASPDTPAWTWSDEQSVGFIRRRQAHEALIHRVDAELAAGDRTPMDPDLSTDGIDEVLRIMYAGLPPWGSFTPDPTQTTRVQATDTDRSWLVTLGQFTGTDADGTAHDEPDLAVSASDGGVSDTGEPAAATVRGAAADLDCWLWHRPPTGPVERNGDPLVLERLDRTIAPGIN